MSNDVQKVYRHELKFLLSQMEYRNLQCLLEVLMRKDQYLKNRQEYYIRSLYFDSVTNQDYVGKMIGIHDRKKIRLRIYDIHTDKVKLEVKNKENDYSLKETTTIVRGDALQMSKGNYANLLKYSDHISKKVYNEFVMNCYMPKVIVDYEREAYQLPIENIRLTFDKCVRATKNCDLFSSDLVMSPVLTREQVILEVKYNKYLPEHIKKVLSSVCMQRMSISKYCMAREIVG